MTVRYKTVKIPDNLHRRIKTYCAHTEQEMSTWCGMVLAERLTSLQKTSEEHLVRSFTEAGLPLGLTRAGWQPWLSTMATNAVIAALVGIVIWFIGIGAFLMVHLPTMLLAASAGVWLFYVQHQFEDTFWDEERAWNVQAAALHGSSHYALPGILRWFTANIGVHHVHHLSSRIPYYRLPEVLREHPELAAVGRLTLVQSLRCVRLVLWDEGRRRLISFKEMAHRYGRNRKA
jgi:omega-6 fatty acid desaturase (delta-12 desaturase)